MNVASLELCRELYELSGWADTHFDHGRNSDVPLGADSDRDIITRCEEHPYSMIERVPAYGLGYLLRKLPPAIWEEVSGDGQTVMLLDVAFHGDGTAYARYFIPYDEQFRGSHQKHEETAEDAVAKLAIELFKHGVLLRQ